MSIGFLFQHLEKESWMMQKIIYVVYLWFKQAPKDELQPFNHQWYFSSCHFPY